MEFAGDNSGSRCLGFSNHLAEEADESAPVALKRSFKLIAICDQRNNRTLPISCIAFRKGII